MWQQLGCVRLNLGCCDDLLPGFINVDLKPPADVLADLSQPWPWADESVDEIRAWDIIEHLPDKIHTMNEAWRVLKRGGHISIKVPTTDGPGAWQDPTHKSYWNRNSFLYFTDGAPEHKRFARHYGIVARFDVVSWHTKQYNNGVVDLLILLRAVK